MTEPVRRYSRVATGGCKSGKALEAFSPALAGVPTRPRALDAVGKARRTVYNQPSGPAAQRPSGPAAQRPSGMTCARREAGALRPAPSAPAASSRPDPRPGRTRARLSRLLPALAVLLGAVFALTTAPALAQSFWSATLTVATVPDGVGCSGSKGSTPCSTQLTDDDFSIGSTEFSFTRIRDFHDENQDRLEISFDEQIQSPPQDLKFCIGTTAYDFPDAAFREHAWTADAGWSAGDTVSLSVATSCSQPPAAPTGLTAPAGDGRLDLAWTAPSGTVTGYDVHYTTSTTVNLDADLATDSDPATGWVDAGHTGTTASHSITGLTNGLQHRLRVRAANAAGASGWLSGYGEPRRAMWTVTLSATPNPVAEGASVTVTATVSQPITGGAVARIPLTVSDGTAEPGDRGSVAEIRIRRNDTAGSAMISTAHDADSDDETFTVAIDTANLPPALAAGSPSSVEIEIRDDEGSSPLPTLVSQVCPASGRVWSATMTAGEVTTNNAERFLGYLRSHPSLSDTGALTRPRFAYRNAAFYGIERIFRVVSTESDTNGNLAVRLDKAYTDGIAATLALHAGGQVFRFADAVQGPDKRTLTWRAAGLDWMANEQVGLCLTDTVVTLSYNDPVYEGRELRLTATVPHPLTDAVTIPVHIADSQTGQGTTLDDGFAGIRIPADAASGTATILMPHDEDTVDESYRVGLGTREFQEDNRVRYGELPAPLVAGNPTSLHVTVYDDDEAVLPAEATLRALRNPVAEGLRAQVRLALSHALDADVTIPLAVTRGTSEDGDHGTLEGIEVPAGEVYGYAHIWTAKDADTGDETFTVALDAANLPAGVKLGSPAKVEVTITDDGEAREPPAGTPTVSLYAHPNPVEEGSKVGVRARLSSLLADDVTIPLVVTGDTSEAGDHGTLASITIPFGFLEAIGEITTKVDADTDDETFTVALDTANLPDGVAAAGEGSVFGGPSATVTIADDGASGQSVQGSSVSAQTDRPPVAVHRYAALIAQMYEWRNDPQWRMYRAHTARWDRALLAFGETVSDASLTPMTAAEAQAFADRGWTRWVEVAEALRQIESGGVRAAAPTPVVTIAAGEEAVTESALVVFTVTAAPAPVSDLDVAVTVGQEGAFVYDWALGAYTVTIPAGETSETLEVLTVDDAEDEPDGAVVVTLSSGAGYALGAAKRVRVAVADDDVAPPGIVTKRAIAREGADDAVTFTVRLDRAASGRVTVDYATADGAGVWASTAPARAGADYTATSGTLAFAAGETSKTVSVPVIDDAVDEGTEYFLLRFSNPQGATLAAGERETQGLIRNSDPVPAGWHARFGRTAAAQAVDAVRGRLGADRSPGLSGRFAGQPLLQPDAGAAHRDEGGAEGTALASRSLPDLPEDGVLAFRALLADGGDDGAEVRSLTEDDVLLGTSFIMTRDAGNGVSVGVWGRAARSGFAGRDGETSVEGEVTGVLLGADRKRRGTLLGLMATRIRGTGTYDGESSGAIDARLTGLVPYAGLDGGQGLSLWGAAGAGRGEMTLTPDDGGEPSGTDLGWSMAAAGAEGALAGLAGADLGWHGDALWTRTASDAAAGLAATSGETTRLRLGLTAAWARTLASGATLGPRLEIGLRHDGGGAETGLGLEVGGGIAFADAARGLSLSLDARTLALHEDGRFRNWGLGLGLAWDPRPETRRGWSVTAFRNLGGATSGGVDALLGPEAFPGLSGTEAEGGWSLEAARGTARGNGMVGSPYGRASGSGESGSLRLGWRVEPDADHAADASVDVWAEPGTDGNEAGAGLQWRW